MLGNKTCVAALLALSLCLPTNGCNSVPSPDTAGLDSKRVTACKIHPPVAPGVDERSIIPTNWYCIYPWDEQTNRERIGIERFAWRLFIAINWPGKLNAHTNKWGPTRRLSELNEPGIYPRWATWITTRQLLEELSKQEPSCPDSTVGGWTCEGSCLKAALEGKGFGKIKQDPAEVARVYDQSGSAV